MKKRLLLSFASLATIGLNGQNSRVLVNPEISKVEKVFPHTYMESPITYDVNAKSQSSAKMSLGVYPRIGGSPNLLSVTDHNTRALKYLEEINTVGMVMRKSSGWTGVTGGNSGTICYAYSKDNGATWDSTVVSSGATNVGRYPTGAMYNPSGNTDPANAFAVVSGPGILNGSAWVGSYFGAKQLSFPGTNDNGNVIWADNNNLASNQRKQTWVNGSYQVTNDGKIHVTGDLLEDIMADDTKWRGVMLNTGTHLGAGSFDWKLDSIKPNFKKYTTKDAGGNSVQGIYDGGYTMTWSENGQIGYLTFFGVDADALPETSANCFQPMCYKTTDGGTTWNRHGALFDFSSIPALNNRLYPARRTANVVLKPFVYPSEGASATVDKNGNMHLICTMRSGYNDHIDSLNYSYTPNYTTSFNYIVDFNTTASGWSAIVLDSMKCKPVTTASTSTSNWVTATGSKYGSAARFQISRTTDGGHIFYSWADSDPTLVTNLESSIPNIFMKGYDVANDKLTETKNMTLGKSEIEYNAYFFYAADKAIKPDPSTFIIPASVTRSNNNAAPYNGDAAVSYYYINDNQFSVSEFTVPTVGANSVTSIKENSNNVRGLGFYPNPASNNGTVEVVMNETAKVNVTIMNSVGQVVNTLSVNGNSGLNKIDVDLSHLSAGMYFYSVKAGNEKAITKKLVIDK